MSWFGLSAWGVQFCELAHRVPVPVGKLCTYCEESIEAEDQGYHQREGDYTFHRDCFLRTIFGSVGHQLRTCACFGGRQDDPVGMTRRQAARAAVRLYRLRLNSSLN